MITYSKRLIKKFLEENKYVDFENKTIDNIRIENNIIYYTIKEYIENKINYTSERVSMIELLGWIINKLNI